MLVILSIETLLLCLLVVVVAGLLRSHAEILARLDAGEPHRTTTAADLPTPRTADTPAFDLAGTDIDGNALKVSVRSSGRNTLLAFLSSGCTSCQGIWESLGRVDAELPGNSNVVVITKDRNVESPTKLKKLAAPGTVVVMSSEAWERYEVPQYPYFIYVDGATGEVQGEGSAQAWDHVMSLLTDALADAEMNKGATSPAASSRAERLEREEGDLQAAGIGPGHPSLYTPEETSEGNPR